MGANSKPFNKKLLAVSISACLLASAGQAMAQQEVEEVIVRGIKSSLERSLDIKRESAQIVEAVSADDIGKMPDQNIAESLQRLPGIQIDRRDGEGTRVRIRGLDQNITLLNGESFTSGMEYFQMGEWKQEFDSSLEGIPSELLGGVNVYKSPTAKLVEGGMGGVVDLNTRSAFKLDDLLVAGNVKVDQGMDAGEAKPSGFLVVGNNWDNRFAAIASLSMSQKTVHTDYIQNFSRENTAVKCTAGGEWDQESMACSAGESYIAPGMFYIMDTEQERERIGGSLNLQWAVSDSVELGFDWFHSDISIENAQYTVKHPMNTDSANGVVDGSADIDSSNAVGVLRSGRVITPAAETNAAGEVSEAVADNYALKLKFDNGGSFRFTAAFQMSSADQEQRAGYGDSRFSEYTMRAYAPDALVYDDNNDSTYDHDNNPDTDNIDNPNATALVQTPTGWAGVAVNPSPDGISERSYLYTAGERPSLEYENAAWLSDPRFHTYKSHWALGSDVTNETSAFRMDFENDLEFGHIKKISYGFRVAEKDVDFDELRYLTNFAETSGVQVPNTYNANGSLASATNFSRSTAPDATNAGVREAYYYDLCGNGGLVAGEACDIDGDGLDDNRGFGPYGYFLDAAIGLKAYELNTSNGTSMAIALYGDDAGGVRPTNPNEINKDAGRVGRWDMSPGYIPWQTYTAHDGVLGATGDASRYITKDDFFRSGGYSNDTVVFQNADQIIADVEGWVDSIAPNSPIALMNVPLESWKIKESTSAFYGMVDFEGDDVPYTLNMGLRVVKTEVEITSAETTLESSRWSQATDDWNSQGVLLVYSPSVEEKNYWDVLPSLNFSLETSDDTKLRFTAAKVIARPSLQSLGRGFSKNYTRIDPTPDNTANADDYYGFTGGTAGNPLLDPYRASQADVAVEWYFGEMGYFSAGAFVKAVESFIASETRLETYADDSPEGASTGGVARPFNGSGGSVSGFEFAFQQAWENGFGINANYTYSANNADVSSTLNPNAGLPGISQNAFNIIGFYENETISGRIAYTWRDEFLSPDRSVFDVGGLEKGASEYFNDYGQWDANITWDVMEQLSLTAEAINIFGDDQSSYLGYPNQPMTYTSQEPRVVLGVNFRL